MEVVGGLITVGNLVLAGVIGVRLWVRSRRQGGSVETGLALYFVFTACLSAAVSCALYMGWADPGLALPHRLEAPLHVLHQLFGAIGCAGAYLFTWRTFRPDSALAKGCVTVALAVMAASGVAIGTTDGFAIVIVNGPAYWINYVAKLGFLPWLAVESFRHWGLQRRRLALGLAEPLVANRFLLWGIWSSTALAMSLSDPVARVWYVARAGSRDAWNPEVALHIVQTMVWYSSALMLVGAAMLFLTFFPTAGYRRWVEARAAHGRA